MSVTLISKISFIQYHHIRILLQIMRTEKYILCYMVTFIYHDQMNKSLFRHCKKSYEIFLLNFF